MSLIPFFAVFCRGICSTDKQVKHLIQALISPLADGYAELYEEQKNFDTLRKCAKEEFFGLRDFYRYDAVIHFLNLMLVTAQICLRISCEIVSVFVSFM